MVNSRNQYFPDSVSPPGETLDELLEGIGMPQAELARRMGRPIKTINEIVKGKTAITPETALQLELVLDIPASFWNNREKRYQEYLARLAEKKYLEEQILWLEHFPTREMIKFGWIEKHNNKIDQLRELLNFFGVASPKDWETIWLESADAVFRQSPAFEADQHCVSAWLRKGEIDAQSIDCAPYDNKRFIHALHEIRNLTENSPKEFVPKAQELCSQAGVALVFIPSLPRTRASGATRWLSKDKALIQLSLRYKTNDHLWFTFFHEAGHILLHGKREAFVEDGVMDNEKEDQANRFAADFLIPPDEYSSFSPTYAHFSKEDVIKFAMNIRIHPGIVVGRLQHDEKIPQKNMNDLKKRLMWVDNEA
jgi:addiction module HigA family antidote